MKKTKIIPILALVLILTLSLIGCKKEIPKVEGPITNPEDKIVEADEETKKTIMDDFMALAEKDEPAKLIEYIDTNIGKLSQLEGDKMVDELEQSMDEHLEDYIDKLIELDKDGQLIGLKGSELFFPQSSIKEIKDKELQDFVAKLFDSKYKLINLEGNFYPIIDYEALETYDNHISQEWKEYLEIMAMDSNKPAFIDAGLVVEYDELANRILKTELYLNKYIDGARYDTMLRLYRQKLSAYLKGLDNTAIADHETKKIKEEVLESYKNSANKENTLLAQAVQEYIEEIEKNKGIIDKKILELADDLVEEAVDILKEFK